MMGSTALQTPAQNVESARKFVEVVLGGKNPSAFDRLVAEDVWVSTGLKPGAPTTSKAEYGRCGTDRHTAHDGGASPDALSRP